MKVKELLNMLSVLNPEADIYVPVSRACIDKLSTVRITSNGDKVQLLPVGVPGHEK